MKVYKRREDNFINAAMEAMIQNDATSNEGMVGSFWYDPEEHELFGVNSVPVSDCTPYRSSLFDVSVRTASKLHEKIWKKEHYRGKDPRFFGDYTQVPRGRVFYREDGVFVVCVGRWIEKYPECKDLVIDEFELPADATVFKQDEHWDIGHGWSNEF